MAHDCVSALASPAAPEQRYNMLYLCSFFVAVSNEHSNSRSQACHASTTCAVTIDRLLNASLTQVMLLLTEQHNTALVCLNRRHDCEASVLFGAPRCPQTACQEGQAPPWILPMRLCHRHNLPQDGRCPSRDLPHKGDFPPPLNPSP